jgi:hypothetical protein
MNSVAAAVVSVLYLASAPSVCQATDPTQQQVVRERSADVMPFDLNATTHIFTRTRTGGIQRVVAKNPDDTPQIEMIRAHLRDIAGKFSRGDFSAPAHVHGAIMPGLADLRAAKPGELKTRYYDIAAGAEIEYSSESPKIVAALHEWFSAQLADHGSDATAGHDHAMPHNE